MNIYKKTKQGINNKDKGTSENEQTKQTGMRNSGNGSYQNAKNNQSEQSNQETKKSEYCEKKSQQKKWPQSRLYDSVRL